MEYSKRDANILSDAWKESNEYMSCPKCGKDMIISQIDPINSSDENRRFRVEICMRKPTIGG